MWARLSIIAGLLAGVAVAVLVLGGLLFLGPGPTPAVDPPSSAVPSASPSVAVPSPTASPSASPSASSSPTPSGSAAASPSASPSPTPSGSAAASPSASAPGSAALFHVGEVAPRLVVPKVGGGTIDLMAGGLGKILPGVKVTP